MATLIPSIGSCVSRMTSGERRLAERLEQKLDDDYLLCNGKLTPACGSWGAVKQVHNGSFEAR